jgi:hypothetical protein
MSLRLLNKPATRWRKILLWVLGAIFFYTVAGFLILPPIIRVVAAKQLAKELGRRVTIEKVRLNPYTLSTTIRGLHIEDKDGQPLLGWDEVYVNLQLVSFFSHAWVFKEITALNPYARLQVNKDYSLNVSDLVKKFSSSNTKSSPQKPAKPLVLRIELFHIAGAKAELTDLTPREPFHRTIGPLEVTLTKFYTAPNTNNPYSFDGTTSSGERFSWSGCFCLDPFRSQGDLSVEGWTLGKYAALYQDLVRFEIRGGVMGVRATYEFEKSAETNILRVSNTSFHLKSLKVGEKGHAEDLLELGRLTVEGVSGDAMAQQGEVASISAADGKIMVRRNRDQSVNLLEMAKPAETATNAPGGILLLLQSVTNAFAMFFQSTNLWTATLHDLNVSNCAVQLEDEAQARPARLRLDEITLNAKELSNTHGTNMTAALSLRWETNGTIHTEVGASLTPPSAEVTLKLKDLDLRPLDPYLQPHVNLLVTQSKLGLDGTIKLRRTNEALPEVTFQGDARLDQLATVDGVMSEDLLKWSSFQVSGIDANLNPPAVAIKELALDGASARLCIETNRAINVLTVLNRGETNISLTATGAKEKKKRNTKEQVAGGESSPSSGKTKTAAASLPRKLSISSIVLSNAQLHFIDRSLEPNVDVVIHQVNGSISGVSSDEPRRAEISLTGKVGKAASVDITGQLDPFDYQSQPADLKLAFKEIDLHPAGPYSGKFIGYRLNKGSLSLDSNYHLSEGNLKSENKIVLDQLMLGEKVESPEATKLPVKLAIAVLKDRNGKIELDVPIDGSPDDPQFHLGKVIEHAIANVITKIVTSPFSALSAVFGGKGEEISFQEFEPGSSELSASSSAKLDSIVKGLYERPGLQLEIEGSVDEAVDRDALKRQKLDKNFRAQKWNSLRASDQARLSVDQVQLTPDERAAYVKSAYALAFSSGASGARAVNGGTTNLATTAAPKPLSPTGRVTGSEKGATALLKPQPTVETKQAAPDMETELMETIQVSPGDFDSLATQRAQRVKEYILKAGNVEPERLFVRQEGGKETSYKGSKVFLHLQ